MKVLKFGGTSVGSAERLKKLVEIVQPGEAKIVVLSAMSGTTDRLVELNEAAKNNKVEEVEKLIGVTLTESLAMWPPAAVSGYYFGNPEAKYFGLGKITDDQVTDYAVRKGITKEKARKWLHPTIADE